MGRDERQSLDVEESSVKKLGRKKKALLEKGSGG